VRVFNSFILTIYTHNTENRDQKTVKEKFAGALYTTTIESFVPEVGRGIQAATSHCLGQNFARMFGIKFEDESKQRQYGWQNSWGFTTRSVRIPT